MFTIQPFNPYLQLHLLRHFEKPSKRYMSELSEQLMLEPDELYKQTELAASKFKREFADNPLDLYKRIICTTQVQWTIVDESQGKTDYLILFKKEQWKNGIGEDSVILLNELGDDQVKSLQKEPKENYEIQTLLVKELPVTFQMVLVVAGNNQVITAFPGRWLPPLNKAIVKDWVFLRKE